MSWSIVKDIFSIIGGITGIGVAVVGVAQLFGAKWIDHWFEIKGKNYQAYLEKITNELSEKLRVEYGSLYQHRVETIESLYSTLIEIKYAKVSLESVGVNLEYLRREEYGKVYCQTIDTVMKHIRSFEKRFERSKIYFPKEDVEIIKRLTDSFDEVKAKVEILSETGNSSDISQYMIKNGITFNILR